MKKYIFLSVSILYFLNPVGLYASQILLESDTMGIQSLSTDETVYEKKVVQTNSALLENSIRVNASTGENIVSEHSGEDILIQTGDVKITIEIVNDLNKNIVFSKSEVPGSNTLFESNITRKAVVSDNTIDMQEREKPLQLNKAVVNNTIDVQAITGNTSISKNIGNITLQTGNTKQKNIVTNTLNKNISSVVSQKKSWTRTNNLNSLSEKKASYAYKEEEKKEVIDPDHQHEKEVVYNSHGNNYSGHLYSNPFPYPFTYPDKDSCYCRSGRRETYIPFEKSNDYYEPRIVYVLQEHDNEYISDDEEEVVYYYYPEEEAYSGPLSSLRGLSSTSSSKSNEIYLLTLTSLFATIGFLIPRRIV